MEESFFRKNLRNKIKHYSWDVKSLKEYLNKWLKKGKFSDFQMVNVPQKNMIDNLKDGNTMWLYFEEIDELWNM